MQEGGIAYTIPTATHAVSSGRAVSTGVPHADAVAAAATTGTKPYDQVQVGTAMTSSRECTSADTDSSRPPHHRGTTLVLF